jgi:hypothetical protein
MKTLLCFGYSYTAEHYLKLYGARFERVWVTVRDSKRAADLNAQADGPVRALIFDGTSTSDDLQAAVAQAKMILVSIPPDEKGDPVLAVCGSSLISSKQIRTIAYLSTVGVYGNYDGAWVDENAECRPSEERNRQRLAAERGWQSLSTRSGIPVAILRLAGIYGPGRNALKNSDTARPNASSSRATFSIGSMWPISRRQSMPPSIGAPTGYSILPMTSRASPAIRSSMPQGFSISSRRQRFRLTRRAPA